jgi:DNA modification methylase
VSNADEVKVYKQDLAEFLDDPANPNKGNKRGRALLESSVKELGAGRSLVADRDGRIVAGNKTREALLAQGVKQAIVVETDGSTPVIVRRTDWDIDEKDGGARKYAFADNRVGELSLTWDEAKIMEAVDAGMDLSSMFNAKELDELLKGADASLTNASGGGQAASTSLAEKFGVPPFSVLDARQGYWQERKRAWYALGINPVAGREHLTSTANASAGKYDYMTGRGADAGGSSFDPVLAELCCRWFCPPGGSVLDPFAGESTKGIVAARLGHAYTGVELRPAQVQVNQEQAAFVGVSPTWVLGDSAALGELLPEGEQYDLVFTSPPYYDLEVYSRSEKDGSALATYAGFLAWYEAIVREACARLRPQRFAVVKVGAIRDKRTGAYHDFVGDNVRIFEACGLTYYNDAVLITPVGTMPIRAGRTFQASRKLCKGHQNVLAFFKGDLRQIKGTFGEVECGDTLDAGSGDGAAGAGAADQDDQGEVGS